MEVIPYPGPANPDPGPDVGQAPLWLSRGILEALERIAKREGQTAREYINSMVLAALESDVDVAEFMVLWAKRDLDSGGA